MISGRVGVKRRRRRRRRKRVRREN